MKAYEFIATTDEVTECQLCGKAELKGTKVLRDTELGEFVFFGSNCGAKALGWSVKEFNAASKSANESRKLAIAEAERVHPLTATYNSEIHDAYEVRKINFAQAKSEGLLDRLRGYREQVKADVAAQFAIV